MTSNGNSNGNGVLYSGTIEGSAAYCQANGCPMTWVQKSGGKYVVREPRKKKVAAKKKAGGVDPDRGMSRRVMAIAYVDHQDKGDGAGFTLDSERRAARKLADAGYLKIVGEGKFAGRKEIRAKLTAKGLQHVEGGGSKPGRAKKRAKKKTAKRATKKRGAAGAPGWGNISGNTLRAKFMREQKASGASPAQARQRWKFKQGRSR